MKRSIFTLSCLACLLLEACSDGVSLVPCSGDECKSCKHECRNADILRYCAPDGSQAEMYCPGGCQNDICYPGEELCITGETACFDEHAQITCDDGKWLYSACEYGCRDGICIPECSDELPYCLNETQLRVCTNEKWVQISCENGCENGICKPECKDEMPFCKGPYERRECIDQYWSDTICQNGCENGACKPECTNEAPFCKSATEKRECINQYWTDTVCENGCVDGVCQPECMNEAPFCKSPYEKRECLNQYWKDTICENGCQDGVCNPECTNEAPFCKGPHERRECVNQFWVDTYCEYGCEDGACLLECLGDEKPFCKDPMTLRECSNTHWRDTYCEDGCLNGECLPECTGIGPFCLDPSTIRECVDQEWLDTECKFGCRDGYCLSCAEGETKCQDVHNMQKCTYGEWTLRECEFGCAGGECLPFPPECTYSDERKCIAYDTLQVCEDGIWELILCPSNVCKDGECAEVLPVCEEGESTCLDIKTREYCENNELLTETCDYYCENGECIPEPEPECFTSESTCIDEKTLRMCYNGFWTDMICEYLCKDGICISEDENYECISGVGSCKDDTSELTCIGNGWAAHECEDHVCLGGSCVNKVQTCYEGQTDCRNTRTILECVNGFYQEVQCPAGYICIDGDCRDANGVFEDPRAVNPLCTGALEPYHAICQSLYDGGKCVETNNDHVFYCVGACDPANPTPYICENHYPFQYAVRGNCETIVDGEYALVPHERFLCKSKCDPMTGCDEVIYSALIRNECDGVPNTCSGKEVSYCYGKAVSYDCAEEYGAGWTCASDQGDVLCAEPCTKEGETIKRCINMPTGTGLVPTNYQKVCTRFDNGKLYYRDIYGEVCDGECHSAGTRCINKEKGRPNCDYPLQICDSMYPGKCESDEVCVIESGQPRCVWRVEPDTQEQAFCATNSSTNTTFYEEYHICRLEDGTYVNIEYIENCADSECNSRGGGCHYLK